MPVSRDQLHEYLNQYLNSVNFQDYAPNGLQVCGKGNIKTIVTGVTACQPLLDAAVKVKADAVLVHHGYFWKGESPVISGMKYHRLKTLLTHDINLFAYHLPLDAHPVVGNNAQLAKHMDWAIAGEFDTGSAPSIGLVGAPKKPCSAQVLAKQLQQILKREPLVVSPHNKPIKTLAWCTGAAQDFIEAAACAGVDAYITGEASERTFHAAQELGIHFFAAGHHATERYGVQALGKQLAELFDVSVKFIDIDNPI